MYLADGDLDTIMGEGEVQEAHASYREVRQSLKEHRLGRGYFPWKGKGKFDPFGKGRGKVQGAHRTAEAQNPVPTVSANGPLGERMPQSSSLRPWPNQCVFIGIYQL